MVIRWFPLLAIATGCGGGGAAEKRAALAEEVGGKAVGEGKKKLMLTVGCATDGAQKLVVLNLVEKYKDRIDAAGFTEVSCNDGMTYDEVMLWAARLAMQQAIDELAKQLSMETATRGMLNETLLVAPRDRECKFAGEAIDAAVGSDTKIRGTFDRIVCVDAAGEHHHWSKDDPNRAPETTPPPKRQLSAEEVALSKKREQWAEAKVATAKKMKFGYIRTDGELGNTLVISSARVCLSREKDIRKLIADAEDGLFAAVECEDEFGRHRVQ